MTDDLDLAALCDTVLELVGDRAEVAVSASAGPDTLTRFANSFIHQNVSSDDVSVHLRVSLDGRSASAEATTADPERLARLVERTLEAASLRPADPDEPGLAPVATADEVEHWDDATATASPDDRAAAVHAFVEAGRPDLEAAGFVSSKAKRTAFANSAGQRLQGRYTAAEVDAIHRGRGGDGGDRLQASALADIDGASSGARAAQKARAQDDAIELEPGQYEVVLEPSCVTNMLVFLGYAGFNGRAVADGTSFVHLGEQQFDERISLWDDAADPRSVGYLFDVEGTPKRRLDLVTAGVTTGIVHDRRSAGRAATTSTGHATGDESFGAFPANMFLGAGDQSYDTLVGGVERGLLVTDFHYTRILDPKTQVVTGLTRNGLFLIEGGEITKAVRNLRFTQSYVAALGPGRVLGVADDARLCSSSDGGAAHVPSVRLASWTFTGGARG